MLVKISVNAYIHVVYTSFTVVSLTKLRHSLSILQIHWKYNSKVYLKYTSSILEVYFKYTSKLLEVYFKYTSSIFQVYFNLLSYRGRSILHVYIISTKEVHLKHIL